MTRPLVKDMRKAIPVSVQLIVALRALGYQRDEVEFDHDPALALREWDAKANDFIPKQLDPDFIVIRTKADHRKKTSGRKGEKRSTSYGSDQHVMAKIRRIQKKLVRACFDEAHPEGALSARGEAIKEQLFRDVRKVFGTARGKRKIPSRPFPQGHRPLRSSTRNSLRRRP